MTLVLKKTIIYDNYQEEIFLLMYFCIFSFNRGQLLKNCVESIEQCVENPTILIFDDNSNDPYTLSVLEEIAKKHEVVLPRVIKGVIHKCGGLYNNMQLSLTYIPDNELVCFVQDDTQLVRKVNDSDIDAINLFFDKNPSSAFFQYAFLKGKARNRVSAATSYVAKTDTYRRKDTQQSAGIYFSAVSIAHADRLKAVNWQFESREKDNNTQAKSIFTSMGFMKNPFLMYLPSAPAYRGKMKTLGLNLAEKQNLCGFHPFNIMSDEEAKAFKERNEAQLPFAEDFLSLKNRDLQKPWVTNPFQGTKNLKLLHKLELTVRNWFK